MIRRVLAWLSGERGPLWAALLAMLISLPALRLGFQADDHVLAASLERGTSGWSLFSISQAMLDEAIEVGAMAWWTSPLMSGGFLRPLASISLAVQLWMGSPGWLMLLVNVLVYGATAWFAALLYRRLSPSLSIAALAGLMFAIDDAHAHSVGWISGGNTILALLGSLAALWFHVRATDTGLRRYAWASVLAVMFALASGEAGTWTYIYLFAHAVVLDERPLAQRLRALAPQLVVGAVWAAIYVQGHYGFHHTSWYLELSQPAKVLEHGLANLPLSITSLLGPSVIGLSIMAPLWQARVVALPIAAGLVWLLWPALWSSRSSRFFGLVTVLGILPAFLTVPQDRVLIGAGFGAFGWIATALVDAEQQSGVRHGTARVLLRGCHIYLAAVLFVPMLGAQYRFEVATKAIVAMTKPGRTVVLINTPVELLANYTVATIEREAKLEPRPRAVHQLYAGGSELWIERTDARTLELTATRGWGHVPVERIFCAPEDMPRTGEERRVRGLSIKVLESTAHAMPMPKRVRFTFDQPLESDGLQWLVWTEAGQPQAWHPPAIGQRIRLAPLNLLKALP